VASREDDDRNRSGRCCLAQAAGDLKPVEPGKADVENDDIWFVLASRPEAAQAVSRCEDTVALTLEQGLNERATPIVVFNDEDGGRPLRRVVVEHVAALMQTRDRLGRSVLTGIPTLGRLQRQHFRRRRGVAAIGRRRTLCLGQGSNDDRAIADHSRPVRTQP
jgi:hypothetical protein